MFLTIVYIIIGILIILLGANWLVDGSSVVARRSGMSEFVIGMLIVGIGTSTPEMVVSFIAAIQGNSDVAMGNIVGSSIFNVFLTLGIVALITPVFYTKENIRRDIPFSIFVTVLLIFLSIDKMILSRPENTLSRVDGVILLGLFLLFIFFSIKKSKNIEQPEEGEEHHEEKGWKNSIGGALVLIIFGLLGLIFGGKLFVNSSVDFAKAIGASDAFIGITLLAAGTSLPELVVSVVAVVKKHGQMALGNVIGSNISNILLILGGSALIRPLTMTGITYIDFAVLLLTSLLLSLSALFHKERRLDKPAGVLFLTLYILYIVWLGINL